MKIKILLFSLLLAGFFACTSENSTSEKSADPEAEDVAAACQTLSADAFRQKISEPNVVLLDVRTPEETAQGKIEGAQELDYHSPDFAAKLEQLDKSKTWLVYCRGGNRSASACELMLEKGFKNIFVLEDGYEGWKEKQQ